MKFQIMSLFFILVEPTSLRVLEIFSPILVRQLLLPLFMLCFIISFVLGFTLFHD